MSTSLYNTYSSRCISDGSKAVLFVNGPMFYFNVTNYAKFENIKFDGSNGLAYYISGSTIQTGKPFALIVIKIAHFVN